VKPTTEMIEAAYDAWCDNKGIGRQRVEAAVTAALAQMDADAIIERCAQLIDEGVERPGIAIKQDTCAHGKFGWEDCEACCAAAIRALKGTRP
jgi:hypothetical protein